METLFDYVLNVDAEELFDFLWEELQRDPVNYDDLFHGWATENQKIYGFNDLSPRPIPLLESDVSSRFVIFFPYKPNIYESRNLKTELVKNRIIMKGFIAESSISKSEYLQTENIHDVASIDIFKESRVTTRIVGKCIPELKNYMQEINSSIKFEPIGLSGQVGRPRSKDDDWAWEEVRVKERSQEEVYKEWRERIGPRLRRLSNPRDSFKKAIKPSRGSTREYMD